MTGRPIIDIVICTYNNAGLLHDALAAIARQGVPPGVEWSVLVVDNNSTDDTPVAVDRHRRLGRIPGLARVHEPIQGLTHARLCGVRNTTAPWIAFVDDDCCSRRIGWPARLRSPAPTRTAARSAGVWNCNGMFHRRPT